MRKAVKIFLYVTLIIFTNLSGLNLFASVGQLQKELNQTASGFKNSASIAVLSLTKGDMLFDYNADKLMNPASVTKIITTAASLKYLSPEYHFKTSFYITPEKSLFIRGSGDPSIIIEELRKIDKALAKKRVCNINNIIIDDSLFNSYTSPGLSGDKKRYNSYTGALSINFNRLRLFIASAKKVGLSAIIKADAGDIEIDIENRVKTVGRKGGIRINFTAPGRNDPARFIVSGQVPIGTKTRRIEEHVPLPPLYFAEVVEALFKERGCKISGDIYRGKLPAASKLLFVYSSKPLSEIVDDMNEYSNNFIAEQLTKYLGSFVYGRPGTTTKGIKVFKDYLSGVGIKPNKFTLVNGSGLSYKNRLSAKQVIAVIQDMYTDKERWKTFYNSLCTGGIEGTVRRRFKKRPLYKNIRAKTGTVDYVKTISGVLKSANDELIAFSIFFNNVKNNWQARKKQDEILYRLSRFRR